MPRNIKYVLVLKDSSGKPVVQEHEISGENTLSRALSIMHGYVDSWVKRDGMEFVSMTIMAHE